MDKIVTVKKAEELTSELRRAGKRIVLVGGCFDILHPGHKLFLEKAKQQGDILIVALENDQTVRRLKGENRPINSQEYRTRALSELESVDYCLLLEDMSSDQDYFDLVQRIKPSIIAITEGDPQEENKRKQAAEVGANISLIQLLPDHSTTKLLEQAV